MSDISPLEKLKTDNVGGSYYLELCDFKLVPRFRPKNRVVDVNLQTNLSNWKRFVFTKNTLHFREVPDFKDGIELFSTEITATIPKDRPDVLQNFKKLRASRWVGILRNRNNQSIVLGTVDAPLIFQLTSRDFKRKVNQRNENLVRFFVRKSFPSPHYLPISAGDAVWLNGEPMQWLNGEFVEL